MPIVRFWPSGKEVEVSKEIPLFTAAQLAGLNIASSCRGNFICGKCNVQIKEGGGSLSEQTEMEQKLLQREGNPLTDRISCVTRVQGDCEITTRYW